MLSRNRINWQKGKRCDAINCEAIPYLQQKNKINFKKISLAIASAIGISSHSGGFIPPGGMGRLALDRSPSIDITARLTLTLKSFFRNGCTGIVFHHGWILRRLIRLIHQKQMFRK
jgi:hypothetical protein